MTPVTTVCHSCATDMMRRPLVSTLMMKAPMIVPRIVPVAAEQRGAADHHRGDRVELVALAERRLRRIQARGDQQAGEAADGAAQRVDDDLPVSTLTPDSRVASSLLPSAKV